MRKLLPAITLLIVMCVKSSFAQQTIMTDFSYPFMEKLVATAKANYPLIKAREQQVKIATNAYKESKIAWFDAISFSYIYNPQNTLNVVTPSIFNGYQAAVSLNLGTLIKNPYIIKGNKENIRLTEYEKQGFELNIEAEVKKRYITYLQEVAMLHVRTNASQEAQSVAALVKHQFEKGTETLENYNKAQLALSDNYAFKIAAEGSALIAKSSLEELLGKKLEDVK
jgi:outer membrane protein TolC